MALAATGDWAGSYSTGLLMLIGRCRTRSGGGGFTPGRRSVDKQPPA